MVEHRESGNEAKTDTGILTKFRSESAPLDNRSLLVGLFGLSGALAGLHLAKSTCSDREGLSDCLLAVIHGALFGFLGSQVLFAVAPPEPDEPGTKEARSGGDDP